VTLTATPATIREIRKLVRHGQAESEIAVRMSCTPAALRRFCVTHQISLVADVIADAAADANAGPDFDRKIRVPITMAPIIENATFQALAIEAKRRRTTTAKLAAAILATVAAQHDRGDNLFAAVLDY
jgi:hypothetical protein